MSQPPRASRFVLVDDAAHGQARGEPTLMRERIRVHAEFAQLMSILDEV